MKLFPKKYFFGNLRILCGVSLLFSLISNFALAQAPLLTAPGSNAMSDFLKGGPGTIALYVIQLVLYVFELTLIAVANFSAGIFGNIFAMASISVPTDFPVVIQLWSVMRDIANSFFIIILLWIALTIIFNFENLGGKRLLIKTVFIALLLNFSLAFVTATFGFTNLLAKVFMDKMPSDVGLYIVNAVKMQEVLNLLNDPQKQAAKTTLPPAGQPTPGPPRGSAPSIPKYAQLELAPNHSTTESYPPNEEKTSVVRAGTDMFLASIGIKSASAQAAGGIWGCAVGAATGAGIGALVGSAVPIPVIGTIGGATVGAVSGIWKGCMVGGILGAGIDWLTGYSANKFEMNLNLAVKMAMGVLFLLLVTSIFVVGSIALYVRLFVMMFLAVLAPLAFLFAVVPNKKTGEWWNKWLSSLFQYAIFAPIFAFLLYMGLSILGAMDTIFLTQYKLTVSQVDFNRLAQAAFGLGFMIAAVMYARKTAGFVGDIVLGYGKSLALLGLSATAGGLAMGAGAIMRRPAMKEMVETGMDKVSRVPILGTAMRPVMRATAEHYEKDRQDVLERSKKYTSMADNNPQALANLLRTAPKNFGAKDAAAVAHASKNEKVMKLLSDEDKQRALQLSSRFGLQREILETNPHLIKNDEDAKRYVPGATDRASAINEVIKHADKSTINKDAIKIEHDPATGRPTDESVETRRIITTAILSNIKSNSDLGKITRESPELVEAMIQRLNAATDAETEAIKKSLGKARVEAIKHYMTASPANRVVWDKQISATAEWRKTHPTYG